MMKNLYRMTTAILILLCLFAALMCAAAASLVGEGTENDPYRIASAADYCEFAAFLNGGGADAPDGTGSVHVRLTANLNFSGKECPSIGTAEHPFRGVFDGDGYTIRGARIREPLYGTGEAAAALFPFVEDAEFRSLHVENAVIDISGLQDNGTLYGGVLVGKASHGVSFSACSVDGTVTLAASNTRIEAGGFCGSAQSKKQTEVDHSGFLCGLKMTDCEAHVALAASGTRFIMLGGAVGSVDISGNNSLFSAQRVITDGNVTAEGQSYVYAGGFAGYINYEPEWNAARTASVALFAGSANFSELFSACRLTVDTALAYIGSIYGYSTSLKSGTVYCADDCKYSLGKHALSGTPVEQTVWQDKAFWRDSLGLSEDVWTFDGNLPRLVRREPSGLVMQYADGVLHISGSVDMPACTVVVALYGADGRTAAVYCVPKGDESTLEAAFDCAVEPTAVKVFFFDSLSGLRPLGEAVVPIF